MATVAPEVRGAQTAPAGVALPSSFDEQAITVLENLDHRGACGCEANTGDGAGILMQVPHEFLKQACAEMNIPVLIHTADPAQFFEPIDFHNERWLELALFGNRRYPEGQFPRFEELMAERDRVVLEVLSPSGERITRFHLDLI